MLNHPCIPEINPTWSWGTLLLICCWSHVSSILLRIFMSTFTWHLVFNFLLLWYFYLVLLSGWYWPIEWVGECSLISFFFFSFFLAAPQHKVILGQGSDLSFICELSYSCSNAGSLTHCAKLGNQTCVSALPRCHQSSCATAGTLFPHFFFGKN